MHGDECVGGNGGGEMNKIEQFEKTMCQWIKDNWRKTPEDCVDKAVFLAREIFGDSEAQGKGLSRLEIENILITIEAEEKRFCIPIGKVAFALLQAGGIGAKEMGVMDITQIIVRHTCENHWYPSSDNACIKLAQALHSVLYGKGEVVYPSFCNDCGAVLQKEGCIICKEKPQEKYCQCGHFTNVSPGMAIAVDKLAPLTCAKCHKEIKLSKSQEKVGKVEPLPITGMEMSTLYLDLGSKINEVIKRLNELLP